MEISFCERCDSSIPQSDIERGVARQVNGHLLCAPCRSRDARRRRVALVVLPLSVLAAAALGAAAAVHLLRGRIDGNERQVRTLEGRVSAALSADAALREAVSELRTADAGLAGGVADLSKKGESSAVDASAALAAATARLDVLEREVLDLKDRVRVLLDRPGPGTAAPEPVPPAVPDPASWLTLLDDPDPGVRLSALVALEPVKDPRVADRALALLSDADSVVRAQAARMVGERADARGIPPLLAMLSDVNALVRASAHRALQTICGDKLGFYDPVAPEAEREAGAAKLREALGVK